MEYILNYRDMSAQQREIALNSLAQIGFCPAHGGVATMRRMMEKSRAGIMPQFYFVFRNDDLIGYMFLIGDTERCRAFPWLAIDNLDELPMRLAEPMIDIAIRTWDQAGDGQMAGRLKARLDDYRRGIGRRRESECR